MFIGLLKQFSNTDGQPWETRRIPIFLITILIVLTAVMAPPQAHARSEYLGNWQNLYPGSTSDTQAGRQGGCQLCHTDSNGEVNGYGLSIAQQLGFNRVDDASAEIQAVQGDDGDGQGDSNLIEITADSQPGWTTGNNPIFDTGNGSAQGTLNPAGIGVQPPLDPEVAVPDIAVAPTTLAFGIVDVPNSNTLTTTITNNGAAVLNVTALNLSGSNEFSLGACKRSGARSTRRLDHRLRTPSRCCRKVLQVNWQS